MATVTTGASEVTLARSWIDPEIGRRCAGNGRWQPVALIALMALTAAACATAGTANTAETAKVWRDRDREGCFHSGAYWNEAAGVCARGGP